MPWCELGKPWHDTTVEYCDVCGNLLIRSYWEFQGPDGSTLRACCEDDQRLHSLLVEHRSLPVEHRASSGSSKAP